MKKCQKRKKGEEVIMGKGSFVFYKSILESIEVLTSDRAKVDEAMGAVVRYGVRNEEYTGDDIIVKCALVQAIPLIEADRAKTHKHGAPKGNQNARKNKNNDSLKKNNDSLKKNNDSLKKNNDRPIIDGDVDVDVDVDKDNSSDTNVSSHRREVKPQKRFTPPCIDEVKNFMLDYVSRKAKEGIHYNFALAWVEDFVDFYGSKGWMVGKNKMKDWKLSASKWVRSQNEKLVHKAPIPFDPGHFDGEGDEHAYDNEAENWK